MTGGQTTGDQTSGGMMTEEASTMIVGQNLERLHSGQQTSECLTTGPRM